MLGSEDFFPISHLHPGSTSCSSPSRHTYTHLSFSLRHLAHSIPCPRAVTFFLPSVCIPSVSARTLASPFTSTCTPPSFILSAVYSSLYTCSLVFSLSLDWLTTLFCATFPSHCFLLLTSLLFPSLFGVQLFVALLSLELWEQEGSRRRYLVSNSFAERVGFGPVGLHS